MTFVTWIRRTIFKLLVKYLNWRDIDIKDRNKVLFNKQTPIYIIYRIVSHCWSRRKVSHIRSNELSNVLRRVDTFTKTCNDSERTSITINHSDSRKQKKASTCAISFLVLSAAYSYAHIRDSVSWLYPFFEREEENERKRNMKAT